MALADLLRAIEADAAAERARADRETAAEAARSSSRARREASALEAELSAAPEPEARAEADRSAPLARLDASVRRSAGARGGVRLTAHGHPRESSPPCAPGGYPALFAALLAESRAALPGRPRAPRRPS